MEEKNKPQNINSNFLHSWKFRGSLYGTIVLLALIIIWGVQHFNANFEQNVSTRDVDTNLTESVPAEVTPKIIKTEMEQFEAKAKTEAAIIPVDIVAAEQAKFLAKIREEVEKRNTTTIE